MTALALQTLLLLALSYAAACWLASLVRRRGGPAARPSAVAGGQSAAAGAKAAPAMGRSAAKLAWIVLGLGALVLFVGGGTRFAIGLTLTAIEAEFQSGRGLVGLAVALFQLVSAVALFWSGRLADRIDPSRVLALGLAIGGIGIGLMALAEARWQVVALYGLVFALGNGIASLIPVGVMISRRFPDRMGTATAIALSGTGLGQLVMLAAMTNVLADIGWRQVYVWLGLAHFAVVPLLLAMPLLDRRAATGPASAGQVGGEARAEATGLSLGEAMCTRHFWLLLAIYALCGVEDFFVSTHVVAFAQDRGAGTLVAGHLLAFMGLAALIGVLAAGAVSDRIGPVAATLAAFVVRIVIFAAVLIDQSIPTVAAFALLFGLTFLVTAPLTSVFVREAFGTKHLGALTGVITMVHHICGGIGGLIGALLFDWRGSYDQAVALMLVSSVMGAALTLALRKRSLLPRPLGLA